MSAETYEWLNTQILVGYTDPTYGRGNAWHYREDLQGAEPNHYAHAIPVDDVLRRLFFWNAVEAESCVRVPNGDGTFRIISDPERKAIVRSDNDTVFAVFKNSYQVHQYKQWLLDTVANIIDDNDLAIGGAGLLKQGAKAYVQVELPETVKTPMGFDIRPHLLACTSHDGTLSSTFQLVSTVVVCDNTLAGALGEKTAKHKVRHSKHSIGKLQSVRDALGIIHEYTDELMLELERLSTQQVTDREFTAIIEHLVPLATDIDVRPQVKARVENKQELLRHLYANDPMVAPWKGTALGVLQMWNTYNHHYAGNDKTRVERNMLNGINGKTSEQDGFVLNTINNLVFA
jgi:phage/plasmid-like protein (TIGR03299 family)